MKYEKKITWTIKNGSSLRSERMDSDTFVVGAAKWSLTASPREGYLAVYLSAPDSKSLPCGWKRHIKVRLTVVNQNPEKCCRNEYQSWVELNHTGFGSHRMLPLSKLLDRNGGFLVNGGEVKIVAEVKVFEVIGESNVLQEENLLVNGTIDVNEVRPSQGEDLSCYIL